MIRAKNQSKINEKKCDQFNKMHEALRKIAAYQSPEKLKKDSEKDWGLEYEEAMEMAYENMQSEAKSAIKGVRPINKFAVILTPFSLPSSDQPPPSNNTNN